MNSTVQKQIRACVLGAESTGKTTLCRDVAERFGVAWVPEFGRWYTEAMPDPQRYTWAVEDFVTIAETQNRFEDDAAGWVAGPLICDTNAFVTSVFCEVYLGAASPLVDAIAAGRNYDLLVICDPDTPFEQDNTTGLRREGDTRRFMHDRYLAYAEQSGSAWMLVDGPPKARTAKVAARIEQLAGYGEQTASTSGHV